MVMRVLLLLTLSLWGLASAFQGFGLPSIYRRPITTMMSAKIDPSQARVLVIGSTGRVGRLVVSELVKQGFDVVCMIRDAGNEKVQKLRSEPVEIVEGDVTEKESLVRALKGCSSCIACFGASRVSKISDIWTARITDKKHPYWVNYMGVKNLVEAAKQTTCKKIVRVTGLSVGYSAFNIITVLLNGLISMTVKYQLLGELELRKSKLSYTIIRPGGLRDGPGQPRQVAIAADNEPLATASITRKDVAGLCVAALQTPAASRATFSVTAPKRSRRAQQSATLYDADTAADPENAYRDSSEVYRWLLQSVGKPDKRQLRPKAHLTAVFLSVSLVLLAAARGATFLGEKLYKELAKHFLPFSRTVSFDSFMR